MHAWSGQGGDIMGPAVTRTGSAKANTPPLKNGSDLRETGYLIAVGSRTARRLVGDKGLEGENGTEEERGDWTVIRIWWGIDECVWRHPSGTEAGCGVYLRRREYACGNWAEDHPRPDAYRSYDWFRDKQTKVYTILRDFLTKNTTDLPNPVQQAKDMYKACMDIDVLDKLGLKPVFEILKELGLPLYPTYLNVTQNNNYDDYNFDWIETVIKVKTYLGMDVLVGFDIFTDPKNSSIFRLVMGSPETTNPFPSMHNEKKRHNGHKTNSYYRIPTNEEFDESFTVSYNHEKNRDENEDQKRAQAYKLFYAELMKLFVIETGNFTSSNINEIELDQKILATSNEYYNLYNELYELESDNETDTGDDDAYLNIPQYTADEIQELTDTVVSENNGTVIPVWKRYLEGVFNISDTELNFEDDKILVTEPDMKYLAGMATIISKTPPVLVELYVWIKVVEVMAAHTTTELRMIFQRSYDEIHSKKLSGSPPPRSLLCASAVNDMMGMAVSYAIADPNFFNVTKPKVQTMLYEMKNSLAHLVGKAKWMDDDTKLATYQKIIQMKTLIGFPDWFMEDGRLEEYYSGIEVTSDTHLKNMIQIIQFKIKKVLNKFRVGNNFTWATDPTEVNAYHTFQENTITVPMVMLQYPFFDLGLDSLNYGSLGTVLGHEITHGFDNFGRQFDKDGNFLPWWTNETVASFVNMTQCFVDQYSTFYVPELGEHVDGKKTLGENIADNGGVREAFAALRHHLHKHGPEPKLPGFEHMTSEQLFFLSYGNLWCGVSTKDSLKSDLEDEHSPQQFRAKGALQNNEEFARSFHCPPGSQMNPPTRCIIF
ncbi:hypothetical protein evm_012509 [Chilo suppressalis]|nr:hypothetical protein evm_012509 [Chilo suppressalis]